MLKLSSIDTGYGNKKVLDGISLTVCPGEIVGLIGPNGSGKSTALRAAHGLLPVWKGTVEYGGEDITKLSTYDRVARGIAFTPQENRVFRNMTVRENLEIGVRELSSSEIDKRIEEALSLFEKLRDRTTEAAGHLSGGEQQMLAISRALMSRPKLLLLDEPSLGLSPNLVRDMLGKISELSKVTGCAVLIVEHKVREALSICDRIYSLKLGKNYFEGPAENLKGNQEKLRDMFL
ncbi:MAG: ABC transporter ATP-binding protein [Candidatus Thiodiazotropha taylori]|nr:ABC transporter ATP-binding protein [Candidatus Thiodiazotropha taylori]